MKTDPPGTASVSDEETFTLAGDYWKHLLVRTPLENVAKLARHVLNMPNRVRHPEFAQLNAQEESVEDVVRKLLGPWDNCVDVGCHLGGVLSLFCRLAPYGRHSAFEPLPYKAQWLRRKFPEVDVHQVALSYEVGELEFFLNRRRSGFSGLKPHGLQGDSFHTVRVDVARLDDVLDLRKPCRLVKIDVEGAELDVLRGATQLLSTLRPHLIFESTLSGMKATESSPARLFALLERLKYRIFTPLAFVQGRPSLNLEEFDRAHRYPFVTFNFVAAPC